MTQETSQIFSIEDLAAALTRMKAFIDSKDHSEWAEFNDAKKTFLEQFKTVVQGAPKQQLWKEFTECADSARNIRKLQEEEGEYAAEMILQALEALEQEVDGWQVQKMTGSFAIFEKNENFKPFKGAMLENLLRFKFLSSKGHQLQALREELAKTGMRLSVKGKLFDRLSKLGDKVFPAKKESSSTLLSLFKEALAAFCRNAEKEQDGVELLFQIRLIQGFLKELLLKKGDYEQIKAILDPLWKKGVLLKDKKDQEMTELRSRSLELKQGMQGEFEALKGLLEVQKDDEAFKLYNALSDKMRDRSLMKADFRELKDQLETLCRPIFDRKKAKIEERDQLLKQKDRALKEEKESLVEALEKSAEIEEKKRVYAKLLSLPLALEEAYWIKLSYYRSVSEMIVDLFELETLYFDLKEIQESLRAELFSSKLDFSLSMALNELYDEMKDLSSRILKRLD